MQEVVKGEEALLWLKGNVVLFVDENVGNGVIKSLKNRGYRKVFGVADISNKGATDAKLLRLLKEKRMVLVTFDRKFVKMASKYNDGMVILVSNIVKKSGFRISPVTIAIRIEGVLINQYRKYRGLYNGKVTNNITMKKEDS